MDLNEAGATITADGLLTATGLGRVRVTVTAAVDGGAAAPALISRSAIVQVVPDGALTPPPPPTSAPPTSAPPTSAPPTNPPAAAPTAGTVAVTPAAPKVGVTQTAVLTGWLPASALPAYRWSVGGVVKSTAPTYRPVAADAGKQLELTAAISVGTETVTATTAVGTVAKGTIKVGKVKVKGTAKVGRTLKAVRSSWPAGLKYTYRWYAGGKAIKGATKASFKVTAAQAGKKLKVKVTAKRAGYTAKAKTSAATKKVTRG
jgi:hypothetical protein